MLGREAWIVPNEAAREELYREGVTLPILLPSEAVVLGRMAEADARELFAAVAKVLRVIPGAHLRNLTGWDDA